MTWVTDRRRWTKKHKGKMYAVSPQALGVEATKEASYQAANAWWIRKRAEIDHSRPDLPKLPLDPSSQAIKRILDRTPLSNLRQMVTQGEAASQILEVLEQASVHDAQAPGPAFPCVGPMRIAEVSVNALERGESIPTECIEG